SEHFFAAGKATPPRHFPTSTPGETGVLSFFHPDMQDVLARAAAEAGAEIWRGATLKALHRGRRHTLDVLVNGAVREIDARLIVGADGRESSVAAHLGFKREKAPPEIFTVGLQLSGNLPLAPALYFFLHGESGRGSILIQTKPNNYRAYLFHHKDALERRL